MREEEVLQKRSRLKSLMDLERNFEGYEEGVRVILQKKKEAGPQAGIFASLPIFWKHPLAMKLPSAPLWAKSFSM